MRDSVDSVDLNETANHSRKDFPVSRDSYQPFPLTVCSQHSPSVCCWWYYRCLYVESVSKRWNVDVFRSGVVERVIIRTRCMSWSISVLDDNCVKKKRKKMHWLLMYMSCKISHVLLYFDQIYNPFKMLASIGKNENCSVLHVHVLNYIVFIP